MKHTKDIKEYLRHLVKSENFHSLIIQSPPGWAKSSTIDEAMTKELKLPYYSAGAYSTPLAFYNIMCQAPKGTILLDDCAGLFSDLTSMAILKAASWPKTGNGKRVIEWSSTSEKVVAPRINFEGKLILLTNVLPKGRDMEAFLSRSLFYPIAFSKEEIKRMLIEAASTKRFFPDQKTASLVVKHLVSTLSRRDHSKYNLRTLRMAYEFAENDSKGWKASLEKLLPSVTPRELVKKLDEGAEPVAEQFHEFRRVTGMSRSVFFVYRQELGLASPDRQQAAGYQGGRSPRVRISRDSCGGRQQTA